MIELLVDDDREQVNMEIFDGQIRYVVGVISVNGKKGEVVLKVSDLENDKNYTVKTYVDYLVQAEAAARENADTTLANNIASILSQITALQGGLQSETSQRQSADTQLQENINSEAEGRVSADSQLAQDIEDEATARAQADSLLQPKETGKGLSTNDYSNAEKQKVADNTTARHTHSNKALLDGLSQEDINLWNTVIQKASASDLQALMSYVMAGTTATNQLTNKDFVNSSIGTNTAYFIGTFNSLEELEAQTGVTNNDYGFVRTTDSAGNILFNRYKYNGEEEEWKYEYSLNNSSFTASQWSAINSGITAELVAQIEINRQAILLKASQSDLTALATRVGATETDIEALENGKADASVVTALALRVTALENGLSEHAENDDIHVTTQNKTNWNGKYSKPSTGIPKTDLSSDVQTSLGKADNAQPKETGKGLSTNDYTNAEKTKVASSVLFTSQTLSDAEKTQARNNIGVEQATITQADIDNIWR